MSRTTWPRVIDAEGNRTRYTYSDRDLMTEQVSEVSGTTIYRYNDHGDLAIETDARGITLTRTYDALDRLVLLDTPDVGTQYTYDTPAVPFSKGRLTAILKGGTQVDYRYDRFGRVIQDGALTYGYDRASDNGCTLFCRCAHELVHLRQENIGPTTVHNFNQRECDAWGVERRCLSRY